MCCCWRWSLCSALCVYGGTGGKTRPAVAQPWETKNSPRTSTTSGRPTRGTYGNDGRFFSFVVFSSPLFFSCCCCFGQSRSLYTVATARRVVKRSRAGQWFKRCLFFFGWQGGGGEVYCLKPHTNTLTRAQEGWLTNVGR